MLCNMYCRTHRLKVDFNASFIILRRCMTWLMIVHRKEHFYFGANASSASSKRKDEDRTGWRMGNWCSESRVSFTHRTTRRRISTNSGCVTRSYPLRKTKEMCNVDRSRCLQTILLDRLLCSFFVKVIEKNRSAFVLIRIHAAQVYFDVFWEL